MSEQDNKSVSDAAVDESGTHDDTLDTSVEDAGGEDDGKVSRSTYKRTVSEAKRLKAELRKARDERSSFEEKLLAAEGNKDEQIKALMKKLEMSEKKSKDLYGTMAKRTLTEQIAQAANKAGCIDADAVMSLADLSELEIDSDTFKADDDEISGLISGLKKSKPYLFSKPAPKVNTKMPNGSAESPEKEDFSKLTQAQIFERLSKL